VPTSDIAVLVRDPGKAEDLSALGVDIRTGDYFDTKSLVRAFSGIDKLMFVSTVTFTDGLTQHRNVVAAATEAGVRHVHYTAIQRPELSDFTIPQISELDRETEKALADSSAVVTILRNTMYFDALPLMLSGDVLVAGVRAPAGDGRAALAARQELGEAAAIILAGDGHAGRTYTLGGSRTTSLAEISAILSSIAGKELPYVDVPVETYVAERVSEGLPSFVPPFLAVWFDAIAQGEFADVTGDLERILGREPLTAEQFVPGLFSPSAIAS
jgi:NAD(P)H dehydrogenase (quinone)